MLELSGTTHWSQPLPPTVSVGSQAQAQAQLREPPLSGPLCVSGGTELCVALALGMEACIDACATHTQRGIAFDSILASSHHPSAALLTIPIINPRIVPSHHHLPGRVLLPDIRERRGYPKQRFASSRAPDRWDWAGPRHGSEQ